MELVDSQLRDGDLSLTLKDVRRSDTGTYECRVKQGGRRRRAFIRAEPVSVVNLTVTETREWLGWLLGDTCPLQKKLKVCLSLQVVWVKTLGMLGVDS